ncbi:MAG: helix-turn-helix domain-containing protein [Thermoplasmatota archaeon]
MNAVPVLERMAGEIALSDAPGQTIRKWRETFGFAQAEVAARLGVSASVVSDYESGRRRSPGIATVRRLVEAFVALDHERGGHILARLQPQDAGDGILAIGEYRRGVAGPAFMERIEGRALVQGDLEERRVHGFTLLDSPRAIASLGATDYVRVYGGSTERALCFTGIKYGRSPMVAVRVHPMKPSLVVYHRPEQVDSLAHRLAEAEGVPLVVTELDLEELKARLRSF